jgi:hypothetical protein
MPLSAVINATSNSTTTLVAGVSGKRISVLQYVVVGSGGATTYQFLSASTALTGVIVIAGTGQGVASPYAARGDMAPKARLFTTAAGEALRIVAGGNNVTGHIAYEVDDAD